MAFYEGSIVVNAPVSEVFAYANAPATMPDWMTALVEVRNVIGSGAGQQWEWTYKMAGVHVRGQSVIVDYILNECATHQGIGMLSVNWTTNVAPHDGGTKLTVKLESQGSSSVQTMSEMSAGRWSKKIAPWSRFIC